MADNVEIVSVMVDCEATIKRFSHELNHILLQPANPSSEPVVFRSGQGMVTIVGTIVDLEWVPT